ncbi:jmjC domain-containing histone demethylation protein 1-like [Macrosteles quadrilineatus]|uniref:jmjC domain-containing histone demethylation protein 1-like n=1 Tax=Macrosteles quadrilineatus TaxID=74068 RepID=UPI0023E097BC|nr:jmjC domain-containing histone demethylation protein 1-like [Macrosteles quadrilineatus]
MSSPEPKKRRRDTKLYSEDWVLGEEEDIEGKHTFNLQEKLESVKFDRDFIQEMEGKDFTISYLQQNGFETPILVTEKSDLGLLVPSKIFSVNDVKICVGSRRHIDVMDVNTQKNIVMTMKEWQKYFDDPVRDKLLNVLSLEFSHTKLDNYVQSPMIVRQIDWVDTVWPRHLKEAQTESTNAIEDMMYPKVQKYCLMSVKGCYTDFHIDFGGTSVWYHILKGSKIFWLIPPTDVNISKYEKWVLSGQQGDVFFGDTVEWCGRVTLNEGSTFFIPSGWIHAVYTPSDSMVFGGNFLHSYCIDTQLRIAQVEETTHVPQKFRYPFFTEMLWYVLERYVHCLLGVSHIKDTPSNPAKEHVHLTIQELRGIKAILSYLHFLPTTKKNVPALIEDPVSLIKDVRILVERHRNDSPASAVTGCAIFKATQAVMTKRKIVKLKRGPKPKKDKEGKLAVKSPKIAAPKRRRTRCKKCVACNNNDCGQCNFCKDMIKFGGTGKSKQSCTQRQCLQPMLPNNTTCLICGKDGWENDHSRIEAETRELIPSSIMECAICYDLVHPTCIAASYPDVSGIVDEDLPNSWECPRCCMEGRNTNYKPRHFKARDKLSSLRESGIFTNGTEELVETVETSS